VNSSVENTYWDSQISLFKEAMNNKNQSIADKHFKNAFGELTWLIQYHAQKGNDDALNQVSDMVKHTLAMIAEVDMSKCISQEELSYVKKQHKYWLSGTFEHALSMQLSH